MFKKIKKLATSKTFLVSASWVGRAIAAALAVLLLTDAAPLINQVERYSPAQVVIAGGIGVIVWLIILSPAIDAVKATLNKRKNVKQVVDMSSLSTRQSALYIPSNVPASLRQSVIWEAEMSGDSSKENVEAVSDRVLRRYFGGIPKSDVANVLAIHESGHATVALALNKPVVGIKRDSQHGATYSLNQTNAPTSEDIWSDILLTVAGTQAEVMWSPWKTTFPTNGHDDRSDAMGLLTILTFAGWSPRDAVAPTIDGLLSFARTEAQRILLEHKDMFDELVGMVNASPMVTAAQILELAKRYK